MKYTKIILLILVAATIVAISLRVFSTADDTPAREEAEHAEDHGHEHGEAEDAEDCGHEHEEAEDAEDHGHEHGEAEDAEGNVVHMSEEDLDKYGIEIAEVGPSVLDIPITCQGELIMNADRTVHIGPRVSGIVRDVRRGLGDHVEEGDILAVIESGELADAKAAYLASVERYDLAASSYEREKVLWEEQICSESEYIEVRKTHANAAIEKRTAEQKLRTLGFSRSALDRLLTEPAERFAVYEVTAPFGGTIVHKQIVLGEEVNDDTDIFIVSDLDTVWADLRVYPNDIALLMKGQEVIVSARSGIPFSSGVIDYVGPVIDQRTRTALARVVLDNTAGQLRPGTFISAEILTEKREADLVVPRDVLQSVDDEPCVFVWDGYGFTMRPVTIGRSNGHYVEIASGIRPGEIIATSNAFRLKAELTKSVSSGCADHGHAH